MLAAFSVILVYSPRYQAYATFVVNAKTAYSSSDTYKEYYNEASADQLSKSFPYILTSGALNDVVAKSLHMDSIPALGIIFLRFGLFSESLLCFF